MRKEEYLIGKIGIAVGDLKLKFLQLILKTSTFLLLRGQLFLQSRRVFQQLFVLSFECSNLMQRLVAVLNSLTYSIH